MASILLKNGITLIHDANNHVVPTQTDILIEHGKIAKLATDIEVSEHVQVIDCTDKIISPGFIDTHHHGWQTQLKGRHANELLLDYMITGFFQGAQFSPEDVFYGQLSGMLECIASGTTTVIDHSHINLSPDHAKQAIAATASSGIRSVYCYTPMIRVKSFGPLTCHPNPMEDWVMQTFTDLAAEAPFGNGRVALGFAFDLWFLPQPVIQGVFKQVKDAGVKTVTTHHIKLPYTCSGGPKGVPRLLKELDLLDERMIISHVNGSDREEMDMIKANGAHISSTPSTELQMSMGRPVCFDASFLDGGANGMLAGAQDIASLGIDCHTNNAGSIVSEARLGLQNARNHFNEHYHKQGKAASRLPDSVSVEAAFNLATVKGAEAARMEHEIGRIQEGFKADLNIFDALSPAMLGAAQHDPVAAIILHSSPGDIETVIVDGVVRKQNQSLLPITMDKAGRVGIKDEKLEWREISKRVLRSRDIMQKEIVKIDFPEEKKVTMRLLQVDENALDK